MGFPEVLRNSEGDSSETISYGWGNLENIIDVTFEWDFGIGVGFSYNEVGFLPINDENIYSRNPGKHTPDRRPQPCAIHRGVREFRFGARTSGRRMEIPLPSGPDFARQWGAPIPPAYPLIARGIRLSRWPGRPGVARGPRVRNGNAPTWDRRIVLWMFTNWAPFLRRLAATAKNKDRGAAINAIPFGATNFPPIRVGGSNATWPVVKNL